MYSDEDVLKQPALQANRQNILIEQIEVDIEPSVNVFEEELCIMINKDRLEKKKLSQSTANQISPEPQKVSIVERRLRVSNPSFDKRRFFILDIGWCTQWTMLCSRPTRILSDLRTG